MSALNYRVAQVSGTAGRNVHVVHQRVGTAGAAHDYVLSEHTSSGEATSAMVTYEAKHTDALGKVRAAIAVTNARVPSDDVIAAFLKQNGVI